MYVFFVFFSVVRLGEKITRSEPFEGNTLAFGVAEYNYCVLHKVRKIQSYFATMNFHENILLLILFYNQWRICFLNFKSKNKPDD